LDRRLRICLVINRFVVGGAETVALDVARSLDPDRYDVTLLAPLDREDGERPEMRRRCDEAGVRTAALGLRNFQSPLSLARLTWFLRRGRFDVVHGHSRFADLWTLRCAAWAGVPSLYWTRHLVYEDMSPKHLARYRALAPKVHRVLAVSETVRAYCLETEGLPPAKVETLVNGIDTDRYAPAGPELRNAKRRELGLADDERMLLFVGRMADQKAPEAFVEIAARLHRADPRVRGFLCGAGPRLEEIRGLAAASGGAATHLGLRGDVPALLGSTDLFVSTSRVEGLPLNVMEAMAAGAAVAAPGLPQIRELMDPGMQAACLYPQPPAAGPVPEEVLAAAAERIRALLDAPERRRELGAAGRERIRRDFSLAAHVRRQQEIYEADRSRPA